MNKIVNILILLIAIIMISLFFRLNPYNLLIFILLASLTIFIIYKLYVKYEENEFVKEQLTIAKRNILENEKNAVIIVKENKILWANDYTYDEFPILRKDQDILKIGTDEIDENGNFSYEGKNYELVRKENVIYIENITKNERIVKFLYENKPNVGVFQLDNHDAIEVAMEKSKFVEFESRFKIELINIFQDLEIFFVELEEYKYLLYFPSSVIEHLEKTRFKIFAELIDKFNQSKIYLTFSMGVAINYKTQQEIGNRAFEAFELSKTRGGGQTVVFDNEERRYYGGNFTTLKNNVRMQSRIMGNTLINILNKKDNIYLISHKNPDSDAIASMVMMYLFLKEKTNKSLNILLDPNISEELIEYIENIEGIEFKYDYVIDYTKNNLLLIFDTQSNLYISHPKILEEVEECIIFDHHQTPESYIEKSIFTWIEPRVSSTVELVTGILKSSNHKIESPKILDLAIMGILTDTNNFKYQSDDNTLEVISFLVEQGGSIARANEFNYLKLDDFKKILHHINKVEVINDFAVIKLYTNEKDFYLSELANRILEIKGIVASVVIGMSDDDMYKVKMRSSDKINCKIFLEEFGGGGHMQQGAMSTNNENIEKLLLKIENYNSEE